MGLTAARGRRQFGWELRSLAVFRRVRMVGCSSVGVACAHGRASRGGVSHETGERAASSKRLIVMLSLCFKGSRPRLAYSRVVPVACALAALGAIGCGNDDGDDGDGAVVLADSGELRALTNEFGIPTTAAVAGDTAWVVESQFDRYVPFGGTEAPAPFRLLGVALDGSGRPEEIGLPPDFFPEGIAATRGGRLFVGSVATGEIYTVDPDEPPAQLFSTDLEPSAVGMTVGNDNATLWVCNSLGTGASQVVGISIADATIVATHEIGTADSFCNDMVMSPDGSLWVTESFGGQIFRIPADDLLRDNSAEVWLQDSLLERPTPAEFGVNGITLLNGQLFLVVTDPGILVTIDPTIENPTGADLREVALNTGGASYGLVRPDGVTAVPGTTSTLLVVENGLGVSGGKRVVLVNIDSE
jgi:sugar lactone lactonase YvrE